MKFRYKLIAALGCVSLASGATCDGVGTKDDPFPAPIETGDDNKPPTPTVECPTDNLPKTKKNIGQKRYVTVRACISAAYAPYVVQFAVRDNTTGEFHQTEEPVVSGPLEREIGYDAGHDVSMHIEVKPARAGCHDGYLYIIDGPGNKVGPLMIDGSWRILSDFRTAR